jgi:lipoate-protein ligase B
MHGLALNIQNDLSLFGKIIPCGIKFRGVTSMERLLQTNVSLANVRRLLLKEIVDRLRNRRRDTNCT